jgi:hypothetical protein
VQGHLMNVASGIGDSPRTLALATPLVVYTSSSVEAGPATPAGESDTQETSNAAV